MKLVNRIVICTLIGILGLLPLQTTHADVCPCNDSKLVNIISNLQYSPKDYRLEAPGFSCLSMSQMSHHFFTSAGYNCQMLAVTWDGTRHAVVGGECCPDGCFYEATQKRFLTISGYDVSDSHLIYTSNRWTDWYDWKYRRGDSNQDEVINICDFVLFAQAYGTDITELDYGMLGDMDLDGDIDIYDFVHFAGVYGT